MRVLIIEPSGRGGVCQHAHNLANSLADLGLTVAMATALGFETHPFPRRYHCIEAFDRFRPRPLRLVALVRFLRRFQPQIVHIEGAVHPGSYLLIWKALAPFTRAAWVYTAHDIFSKNRRPYHPRVLTRIYRGMDHLFVNAVQNRQELINHFHIPGRRVTALPVGELTAFVREKSAPRLSGIAADARVVLFFGIIEARKGLMTLIEAFPRVIRQVPQARLLVVGQAHEEMAPYYQRVETLGIGGVVSIRPDYVPLAEVASVFGTADMVALPYLAGWNSGVVASAFGFGKPVVATRIKGVPEVIEAGRTGLLVPPNDPAALAEALIALLKDDALRTRMGAAAREAARDQSWQIIGRGTQQSYQQVLDERKTSGRGTHRPSLPTGKRRRDTSV